MEQVLQDRLDAMSNGVEVARLHCIVQLRLEGFEPGDDWVSHGVGSA
jgi:hypothetical protein